jgi:hypothetical protein
MTERGFISKKSDLNYWVGIETIKSVNDFVDGRSCSARRRQAAGAMPRRRLDPRPIEAAGAALGGRMMTTRAFNEGETLPRSRNQS